LAITVYAVKQSRLPKGADVAILGSGPIGLCCMLNVKAGGTRTCYMTEKIGERVKAAAAHGATWVGNPQTTDVVAEILKRCPLGMDIVYECAGQQETIDQAIDLLKPGGKLMLIGIPREDRVSFSIDKARRKELSLIDVRRQNGCTQTAIDLILSGKAKVDFMATHKFKLEQTKEAFDLVAGYQDGVIKAIIEM
jgi:threonine dehydrogenase-like Zn-dependent dehydrogenase